MSNGLAGRCSNVVLPSGNLLLEVTVTADDLCMGNVVALAKMVRELLSRDGHRYVVIDLRRSDYIDSTVIGWLFELRTWSRRHGGEAVIVTQVPHHVQVIEATCLDKILKIVRTREEADDLIYGLEGLK